MTVPAKWAHQDGGSILPDGACFSSLKLVEGIEENITRENDCTRLESSNDISTRELLLSNLDVMSRDDSRLSESHPIVSLLSDHSNRVGASMRTEVGDDTLDDCPANGADDLSLCFFPEHRTLCGSVTKKVVRYAQNRINKVKLAPCERAKNMTTLRHDQLELGALLGEGSFSAVYSIRHINGSVSSADFCDMPDASQLVVKVLRKKLLHNAPMLAACAADVVKEGLLLSRLSHENVLSVHAWAPGGVEAFSSGRHDATFLVLGKLEITLSAKLAEWRGQKRDLSRNFITSMMPSSRVKLQSKWQSFQDRMDAVDGLMGALVYLHSQQIVHRDLKPDNIGFDAKGVLKVFDFDVARLLPTTLKYNPSACYQMTKRVGSPRYMSPECARGDPYNAKSDVYTVALLLHELFSLDKPYEDIPSELHDDMVFYTGARPPLPPKWPPLLKLTLQRAWNERISLRLTMSEFQADWNSQLKEVLLAEKRKRYSRGLVGKQVSYDDSSALMVDNTVTRMCAKKALRKSHDLWDSARTSPDSCHEYTESVSTDQ